MKDINDKDTNMSNSPSTSKKSRSIFLIVLKRHKISLLLIIFLLLVSSTLCWFIYNTKVDVGVQAHVKAWYFDFDYDEDAIEFDIDDLYPGIGTQNNTVTVVNRGEIDGYISIDIESITLFGENQVEGENFTIERDLENNTFKILGYPFDLIVKLGKNSLAAGIDDSTSLDFTLNWEYENNEEECFVEVGDSIYNKCDMEDTEFGEKSYEFSSNPENKDLHSLIIKLKVDIVQAEG